MWQLLFPARSLRGDHDHWLSKEELSDWFGVPERIGAVELRRLGCSFLDVVGAGDRYARSPDLRRALHLFKYRRVLPYCEPLSKILLRALPQLPPPQDAVLCPVPLHWTRLFLRGFNQSRMLAERVARATGLKVSDSLLRMHATGWQSHRREKAERSTAMRSVFAVNKAAGPLPNRIILVDDIFTSGATLDACAECLKQAGVQWVGGVVMARR